MNLSLFSHIFSVLFFFFYLQNDEDCICNIYVVYAAYIIESHILLQIADYNKLLFELCTQLMQQYPGE